MFCHALQEHAAIPATGQMNDPVALDLLDADALIAPAAPAHTATKKAKTITQPKQDAASVATKP